MRFQREVKALSQLDHAGIEVTLKNERASFSAQTLDGGSYHFRDVPLGWYSLSFDKGRFHDEVPKVLVMGGESSIMVRNELVPVPAAIWVPPGRRITDLLGGRFVAGSADGAVLLVDQSDWYTGVGTLELISGADARPRTLDAVKNVRAASVSRDGTKALVGDDFGLRLWPLASGHSAIPLSSGRVDQARFLGDGSAVRLIENVETGALLQVMSTDGAVLSSTSLDGGFAWEAAVSRDGGQALLCHATGFTARLAIIPVAGGPPRYLAGVVGSVRSAWFSPDDTQVYFSEYSPEPASTTIWTVAVSGGAPRAVVSNISSHTVKVSSDGRRVAYLTQTPLETRRTLRLHDLESGAVTLLSADGDPVHFSPDGTQLAYFDQQKLRIVPVVGGRPTVLDAATSYSTQEFSFSPDGSKILMSEGSFGKQSLWAIPTSGAPSARLMQNAIADPVLVDHDGAPSTPWLDEHHVLVRRQSPLFEVPKLLLLEVP
jgi:WD40 repeat protein